MKDFNFTNSFAVNQLSVNDVIRNLCKMLAFKYKSHDAHFTRVADDSCSANDYLIRGF